MKQLRYDLLLIALLLLLSAAAWLLLRPRGEGAVAVVTVDGAEAGRYPLSEDRTVRIESPGGYNLLTIAGGAAAVTEADCGDHTCVRTGEIRLDGQSIICLPHKVVITVEGGEADGVDLSAH